MSDPRTFQIPRLSPPRERWEWAEWNRRQWLSAGAFGAASGLLPFGVHRPVQASKMSGRARAKNVLLLIEHGGMSHVDTWDPRPEAPVDHRTPFKMIDTNVPGVQFTELLSHTAQIADRLAVVRSMHHVTRVDDHPRGMQYMLTGEAPGGPVEMPDMGCVAALRLGSQCQYLPPYIQLPATSEMASFTRTGFLPEGYAVFKATARDASDPKWQVPSLRLQSAITESRFQQRRSLLTSLNHSSRLSADPSAAALDTFYDQASNILLSQDALRAFDISTETADVRERYGQGHRGACYLLGRKLIEAGVRTVAIDVRWPFGPETPKGGNLNWDHHDHIYSTGTCELPGASGAGAGRYGIGHWVMMGSVDRAFSTLILDLEQRGLLDETLVCLVTEFGRTPRVNVHGGRDHWPDAYSIVFAGAGIRGGQIIGETDRDGGYVKSNPYTPEDYAATIYEYLGIDREQPLYNAERRPIFLAPKGRVIQELG